VDSAEPEAVEAVRRTIAENNPKAKIVLADSEVLAEDAGRIKGKRVLVVEDGPTLTHGEMTYGAGVIAAQRFGAAEMVDPRPYLVGTLKETFASYPAIGTLLPAMGYSAKQVHDLEATINATDCDLVLAATPIDLTQLVKIDKPCLRIRYEYKDNSRPALEALIGEMLGADS